MAAKRTPKYKLNDRGEVVEDHIRTEPQHRSPAYERQRAARRQRRHPIEHVHQASQKGQTT